MKTITYIIMMLTAVLTTGCHNHDEAHGADDHSTDEHAHAGEIIFTRAQAQAAGLKLETAVPGPFSTVIKTSGKIQYPQGSEHTIVATTTGIIRYVNPSVTEGTPVTAGSAIVTVTAEKMQDGDPVKKAKLAYETAGNEYRRATRLVEAGIISQTEYEQIKMKYELARESYIGHSANVTTSGILVKSPVSGYIKNRIASNGEYVTAGQPVAVVAESRRLQLRADIPERYYAQLGSIRTASFVTTYDETVHSLDSLNGRLISYGRTTSEGSSYIPVTFEFDNIGSIIPGTYTEVYISTGIRNEVMSLPVSAITEEQGLYYVYIREHDEAYRKQEVSLGSSDGTRVEITKGIHRGDRVVVSGAYQVKMASATAEIPGHTH